MPTIAACVLAGCVTVDARPDYDLAADEIRAATGVGEVYRPGDDQRAEERMLELLEGDIELREAVEVALLNNPAFRATLRTIGMAKAARVQAGLLTNPSLQLTLRFPASGGGTVVEGNLFASLLDLWQIPARVETAEAALQRQILEVAQRAVRLAAAVRSAYIDAVTAERLLQIADENRTTAASMLGLAEERVAARAATAIDANLARLDVAATEIAWRDARLARLEAKRALATLLGLDSLADAHGLAGGFATELELPSLEWLNDLAEASRLDLRAAQHAVEQASAELDRQRGLLVQPLNVGAAAEKEGEWTIGPAIQLQLPLFDQNQAQIAEAVASLEQQRQVLAAIRLDAVGEVASARARAEAGRDVARMFSEQILVAANETLELTREAYRAGKTTIVPVLEAQRSLLQARRDHVERLQQAATALSDLERATGTPRETLFSHPARRSP